MYTAREELVYLESSSAPETSHGFQDCFPQSPRQSTAVREVCFKDKVTDKTFLHFVFKRKMFLFYFCFGLICMNVDVSLLKD